MREITEIRQQDQGDVFYDKQHVGDQLHSFDMFNYSVLFNFLVPYCR